MLVVKCAKCKKKVFRYRKIGKGKLWRCWKDRIVEDFSNTDGDKVKCQCGNVIGTADALKVKIKQHAITYSGSYENK